MAYDSREAISSSMTLDEIKDAPILPKGHFYGTITRFECRDGVTVQNNRGGTSEVSVVDFFVGNLRPAADVDPSRIDGLDLASFELSRTFWWTPQGAPELRNFLKSFGFPGSATIDSLYHETVGREVLCTISPRTYKSKRTGKDVTTTNLDDMVATKEEVTALTDLSKPGTA